MQLDLSGTRMHVGFWIAARCFLAKRIRAKKPKFGKRPLARELAAANPLTNCLFWQSDGEVVGWPGKLSHLVVNMYVYTHANADL